MQQENLKYHWLKHDKQLVLSQTKFDQKSQSKYGSSLSSGIQSFYFQPSALSSLAYLMVPDGYWSLTIRGSCQTPEGIKDKDSHIGLLRRLQQFTQYFHDLIGELWSQSHPQLYGVLLLKRKENVDTEEVMRGLYQTSVSGRVCLCVCVCVTKEMSGNPLVSCSMTKPSLKMAEPNLA